MNKEKTFLNMMDFLHLNVNSLLQHKIRHSSKNNEKKHNNILYTSQYNVMKTHT